ncbi:methyltransferase [Pokkaliibacter sp. CJK22405]|uniref:methyltransferase n=1 Tax=Pokkaliibacter sp. CJK22405 TaxID=3384615 RepID=UPI0039856AA9
MAIPDISALGKLLSTHEALWRPIPFYGVPEWTARHPQLLQWIRALSEERLAYYEQNPDALLDVTELQPFLPLAEIQSLITLPVSAELSLHPEVWGAHINGRKWLQIQYFASSVMPYAQTADLLVEWCAGKGHLGRLMSRLTDKPVRSVEWDAALCKQGELLAQKQSLNVQFTCADVLKPFQSPWCDARVPHVMALHACGDLHTELISKAVTEQLSVSMAPCCYHRIQAETYQPLSRQGKETIRANALSLDRESLRLAVQETVTAPGQVRAQREHLAIWRLAADLCRQALTGDDAYKPSPSLSYGQLPEHFKDYLRQQAKWHGFTVPDGVDDELWLQQARERFLHIRQEELVRHLFRRPLEIFLIADRALVLSEAGMKVDIEVFCPRELSPRNVLITAVR